MEEYYPDIVLTEEELLNGYSAEAIFRHTDRQGITFDDLIVLPGSIDFGVHEVDLRTRVTKKICIQAPLCSTPMGMNY
jgi:IMP dehydrogenase